MDNGLDLQHHQFQAMGSHINLWLDHPQPEAAAAAFAIVEDYFAAMEQTFSRFRTDSELSRVNECSGEWVEVSLVFWDVLDQALGLAELTAGLYDPLLLPALEAAGYVASFETLDQASPLPQPPRVVSGGKWRQLELDVERRAIRLPLQTRLSLDGMVKGYTAAMAVQTLAFWGPSLVDAGGDIVAGAAPGEADGWPVAVAAPGVGSTADLLTISLAGASLATSGIDYRHWQNQGRPAHHIIDPRTGRPADTDLLSVTVLLKRAVQAEAVATAVMVIGQHAGFTWLADRNIPAVLVTRSGHLRLTPAMEAACYEPMLFKPVT